MIPEPVICEDHQERGPSGLHRPTRKPYQQTWCQCVGKEDRLVPVQAVSGRASKWIYAWPKRQSRTKPHTRERPHFFAKCLEECLHAMVAAFVRSTSLRACATLVRPAYGTVPSIAACATPQYRRALSHSSQKAAEVADVSLDSSSAASGSSSKDHSAAQKTDHAIRSTREALEKKKEQKFAEYEELLKQKAAS